MAKPWLARRANEVSHPSLSAIRLRESYGGLIMEDRKFIYVYCLRSKKGRSLTYIGLAGDLKKRLQEHNTGKSTYTKRWVPWRMEYCIAVRSKEKAKDLETYLKSGSGRAFA